MFRANRVPPQQMRAAHNRVKDLLPQKPEILNIGNALELGQKIPLLWDGVEYQVKAISFREGLELQRASMTLERLSSAALSTPEEIEDAEADLIQTVALFHSLLDPKPELNPFATATLPEVGAILGFYLGCQMMQRGSSRLQVRRIPTTRLTH